MFIVAVAAADVKLKLELVVGISKRINLIQELAAIAT